VSRKIFLSLNHDFMASEAVLARSANAKALILGVANKYGGNGAYTVRWSVTETMYWLHCSRSTAIRTMNELKDADLVQVIASGSFDHKAGARSGISTLYKLKFGMKGK
jgi:hypothetical protein